MSALMMSCDAAISQSFRHNHNGNCQQSQNRLLDQPTLPQTFDVKGVKMLEAEQCMICEIAFTRKLKVLNRTSMKNCKRCGRAVCDQCSDQRRQLALQDTTLHRICDKCDTEMDNFRLRRNH